MSAPPVSPPRRTSLAGGRWIRFRRLPGGGGTAVLTGEDGRFLLLPGREIDALCASDPGDARRRQLAELGFLLPTDGEEPRGAAAPTEAERHVLVLGASPAEAGAAGPMSEETACAIVDRVVESGSGFRHVELTCKGPLDPALVRRIVDRVSHHRAAGRRLSLGLRTGLVGMTPDLADALVEARAMITVALDGPPTAADVERVRALHARHSARGIAPSLAFVRGVVPVNRAALAEGAERLVAACVQAGLVFVELAPAGGDVTLEEHFALYREAVRRILDVNAKGTLLVEMPLALHLETLVAHADPSRARPAAGPIPVTWGPDGRPSPGDTSFPATGCAGCAYDPYCGAGLLREALDDAAARRWGTPFCRASTGMFDMVFELLASPDGQRLRRVFRSWMEAHERVARRLAA